MRVNLARDYLNCKFGSVGCSMGEFLLRGDLRRTNRLVIKLGLGLLSDLLEVLSDWK